MQLDESSDAAPPVVRVCGGVGLHSRVNGLYSLSASLWQGRPVYARSDGDALSMFFDRGGWVVAEAVAAAPRVLARRACSAAAPPADGVWEFPSTPPGGGPAGPTAGAGASAAGPAGPAGPSRPAWLREARAEARGGRVHVEVAAHESAGASLERLGLEVGARSLRVELAGHEALVLPLPAAVDAAASPLAKWLPRERTLRVQLALLKQEGGAGG